MFTHAVAGPVVASDVEVQIDVNAALEQFRNEEILMVELLSIEVLSVVARGINQSSRRSKIEKMEPGKIDTKARERVGPNRRVLLRRYGDGAPAPLR